MESSAARAPEESHMASFRIIVENSGSAGGWVISEDKNNFYIRCHFEPSNPQIGINKVSKKRFFDVYRVHDDARIASAVSLFSCEK